MNKLISFGEKGSEGSLVGFRVAEKEPREGFSFLVTVTGWSPGWEREVWTPTVCAAALAAAGMGPHLSLGTQASVCAGSVMGPHCACSPNKGSVSATVRHKGQRSPVYFGLETFKWRTAKTFEFSFFSVSYKKTNCSELGIFGILPE